MAKMYFVHLCKPAASLDCFYFGLITNSGLLSAQLLSHFPYIQASHSLPDYNYILSVATTPRSNPLPLLYAAMDSTQMASSLVSWAVEIANIIDLSLFYRFLELFHDPAHTPQKVPSLISIKCHPLSLLFLRIQPLF